MEAVVDEQCSGRLHHHYTRRFAHQWIVGCSLVVAFVCVCLFAVCTEKHPQRCFSFGFSILKYTVVMQFCSGTAMSQTSGHWTSLIHIIFCSPPWQSLFQVFNPSRLWETRLCKLYPTELNEVAHCSCPMGEKQYLRLKNAELTDACHVNGKFIIYYYINWNLLTIPPILYPKAAIKEYQNSDEYLVQQMRS